MLAQGFGPQPGLPPLHLLEGLNQLPAGTKSVSIIPPIAIDLAKLNSSGCLPVARPRRRALAPLPDWRQLASSPALAPA